jgi:hypothetical protein
LNPVAIQGTFSSPISLTVFLKQAGCTIQITPFTTKPAVFTTINPPSLSFSSAGFSTQTFIIQFGLPQPASSSEKSWDNWPLNFLVTGCGIDQTIQQQLLGTPFAFINTTSLPFILSSAAYTLDTSAAVSTNHAGWVAGAVAGTGVASFDGSTQYLDPMNPLDNGPNAPTGQVTMPLKYGGSQYGKKLF